MFPTQSRCLLVFFLFLHGSAARAQAYERARPSGVEFCRNSWTFTYSLVVSDGHPSTEERTAIDAVETWRQAASTCSDLVFDGAADATKGKLTQSGSTLSAFRAKTCNDVVPSGDACWTEG